MSIILPSFAGISTPSGGGGGGSYSNAYCYSGDISGGSWRYLERDLSSITGIKAISAWFKIGYTTAAAVIVGGLGYGTNKTFGSFGVISNGRVKLSDGNDSIKTNKN